MIDPARPSRAWRASPLLRFFTLGAALFALDAWRERGRRDTEVLALSPAFTEALRAGLRRERGREPTAVELLAREREHLRDEALYRHALALGLHRGDDIVRRRLVQKAMYLLEAQSEPPAPREDELRAWLAAHPDDGDGPRITLDHRFFSRDPGEVPDAGEGEVFLRGERFEGASRAELDGVFGEGFTARLAALPQSQWAGPVRSAHGWHRVRWTEVPALQGDRLARSRARAERGWRDEARARRVEAAVDALVARYRVERR